MAGRELGYYWVRWSNWAHAEPAIDVIADEPPAVAARAG
jgi:hypothetical protein